MSDWQIGQRVRWTVTPSAVADYGPVLRGVVADAPRWPPVHRYVAPGERIPVDLDGPVTIPERPTNHAIPVTRLWVREQFLEVDR